MFPAKFISSLGQIPSEMVSDAETTQTSAGTFLTQRTAGAEVRRGFIKNKKIKIIKEMRQGCWGAWGSLTVAGGHIPAPHHFQTLTCNSQKPQKPLCRSIDAHPSSIPTPKPGFACLVCSYASCLISSTLPPLGSLPAHPRLRGCCAVQSCRFP